MAWPHNTSKVWVVGTYMVRWIGRWPKYDSVLLIQCSGSVTFWYRSGSSDPYLSPTDPDPDPDIFVSDLKDANKKTNFYVFCLLLYEGTIILQESKVIKKSQNSRNQGFLTIFASWWDSGDPDPYIWQRIRIWIQDAQKTYDSDSGTLLLSAFFWTLIRHPS